MEINGQVLGLAASLTHNTQIKSVFRPPAVVDAQGKQTHLPIPSATKPDFSNSYGDNVLGSEGKERFIRLFSVRSSSAASSQFNNNMAAGIVQYRQIANLTDQAPKRLLDETV